MKLFLNDAVWAQIFEAGGGQVLLMSVERLKGYSVVVRGDGGGAASNDGVEIPVLLHFFAKEGADFLERESGGDLQIKVEKKANLFMERGRGFAPEFGG